MPDGREPRDARRAGALDELGVGGSQASRWQWVSITARGLRPRPPPRRLDPREELAELADLRAAADGAELRAVERQVLAPERGEQPLGRGRA